ncbi:hypothetical protein F5Y14DRAFT_315364 [Nemania sp. NC0429]|nr:hypothetical protein F5Y14DRAFT_315364 [Nemania sp. NC0429]
MKFQLSLCLLSCTSHLFTNLEWARYPNLSDITSPADTSSRGMMAYLYSKQASIYLYTLGTSKMLSRFEVGLTAGDVMEKNVESTLSEWYDTSTSKSAALLKETDYDVVSGAEFKLR